MCHWLCLDLQLCKTTHNVNGTFYVTSYSGDGSALLLLLYWISIKIDLYLDPPSIHVTENLCSVNWLFLEIKMI